jgi:hypothetical protein
MRAGKKDGARVLAKRRAAAAAASANLVSAGTTTGGPHYGGGGGCINPNGTTLQVPACETPPPGYVNPPTVCPAGQVHVGSAGACAAPTPTPSPSAGTQGCPPSDWNGTSTVGKCVGIPAGQPCC